jgi:hypothetical protein
VLGLQIGSSIPGLKYNKNPIDRGCGCSAVVEHIFIMFEVLCSIPSTKKEKKIPETLFAL